MDQHDLKASGMANDVQQLCSLREHSHLGEANSLSDCFGTCTDGNAGLQKQDHESDHETSGRRADKLPEMERNYLISSTDCAVENMDVLRQPSPVISTMKESILGKEHCAEGTSAVISCCNGLEGQVKSKQGEVSALSLEGNTSTKNISMKSDISSDSGQRLDKENNELVDGRITGYWSNAGESGLKSVMQTSFHDKLYKTESSSSNSTHITLPASSNDSCQVTSMDVKACTNSKTSAMDTSTCTDFKSNLKEPAVRILAVGMASQASKDVLDSTIFHPGKQQNATKVSEIVNVRSKDSYRVLGMISDHNSLTVEDIDLQNPNLFKKKVTEDSNHDKVQPCYVLDDALEVARRVAREVEREVGTFREVSGSSSSVHEKSGEAVHMSSVDSADSNKRDCLTETGSEIQFCCEQDNSDSFCSIKEVVDLETSARNEGSYLEVKEPSHGTDPRMMNVSNDCLHRQESSFVTTKPEDGAASDQTNVFRFDLNENILANEDEYPGHSVNGTISCHAKTVIKPVPVLAKSGIPFSLPLLQSKCEEELGGWRRSAASAFRKISLSKSYNRNKSSSPNDNNDCSKQSQVKGIDLNVAAAGVDFDMELLPDKCVQEQSSLASEESSMEVSSKRAKRFHFDLNFVSENDDSHRQLSPPASLSGYSVRDFDLNDNPTSVDASIDTYQPGQGTQALRNGALDDDPAVSFLGIAKQPDSRSVGTGYLAGVSSLHGFTHGHSKSLQEAASNVLPSNEQMQIVHPLHHKLTYTAPPQAPPHAFLYNNGFCIDPNSLASTVYPPSFLPYITDPRGTTVIPQVLGSGAPHIMSVPGGMGALSAFSGARHMMSFPGGSGPSDIAFIRPSFDLNGIAAATSENGSRVDNARQLFIPVSNSTLEDPVKSFQQVAFPAPPMKRREPDGGWDSHQLSYRQVTSWQ
ncbi:uncharacterized protein LOC133870495 [Alnus glutinosa]|uniref:uncharacterized protein LOC133870495 n=1 Tax=Alnus glutinosa TaxID=3517 RepID=UPI002D7983F8|nr:uncharacterized protein LOC133870495 [Alnus glutinosa]XP_062163629.1 uncharacterized protein LOC133870495 [Alnus glutinosa]XP_062163630.1 uncharacterized protein LOC133870495 [Alnus glutinosa]